MQIFEDANICRFSILWECSATLTTKTRSNKLVSGLPDLFYKWFLNKLLSFRHWRSDLDCSVSLSRHLESVQFSTTQHQNEMLLLPLTLSCQLVSQRCRKLAVSFLTSKERRSRSQTDRSTITTRFFYFGKLFRAVGFCLLSFGIADEVFKWTSRSLVELWEKLCKVSVLTFFKT